MAGRQLQSASEGSRRKSGKGPTVCRVITTDEFQPAADGELGPACPKKQRRGLAKIEDLHIRTVYAVQPWFGNEDTGDRVRRRPISIHIERTSFASFAFMTTLRVITRTAGGGAVWRAPGYPGESRLRRPSTAAEHTAEKTTARTGGFAPLCRYELVGGTRIELVTPSMSRKCSTAELTARRHTLAGARAA